MNMDTDMDVDLNMDMDMDIFNGHCTNKCADFKTPKISIPPFKLPLEN